MSPSNTPSFFYCRRARIDSTIVYLHKALRLFLIPFCALNETKGTVINMEIREIINFEQLYNFITNNSDTKTFVKNIEYEYEKNRVYYYKQFKDYRINKLWKDKRYIRIMGYTIFNAIKPILKVMANLQNKTQHDDYFNLKPFEYQFITGNRPPFKSYSYELSTFTEVVQTE